MVRQTTFARLISLAENRSAQVAVRELGDALREGRKAPAGVLTLHGPAGTGKSHLADALRHEVAATTDLGVQRFDANELNLPITTRSPGKIFAASTAVSPPGDDDWRVPARTCALLIVEDLQHLGPVAADMLAEVLDCRAGAELATLLTARVGPQHLSYRGSRFPARLTNRLAGGLVVHLSALCTASRLAMLTALAGQRRHHVPDDVLAWLADRLSGGAGELLAALERLDTLRLLDQKLDLASVMEHFQQEAAGEPVGLPAIARQVGAYFQIDARLLQSRSRSRSILLPRQVSMFLARQLTLLSLEQIGDFFGGRDHSTVLHACRKVEQALTRDPRLSGAVRQLQAELA